MLGFAVQDVHGAVDHIPHVELLPVDFAALLQHAAKPLDDVVGALIVFANVGEDLTDQVEIRLVAAQDDLRCRGVVADGAERLVELVRDGCRQCTGRGGLIEVDDFEQPMARLCLRGRPATALHQQRADDKGLQRDQRE